MPLKSSQEIDKQAAALLGLKPEVMGKSQARQNFLPLVDALNEQGFAVQITDHDKPVAMLLSYSHWLALLSKLAMLSSNNYKNQPVNLVGSVRVVGNLKAASKKIANQFQQSVRETARKL